MQDAIIDFAKQFAYKPVIENKKSLLKKKRFIIIGMGGSHLAADILQSLKPELPLSIWCDYDLPPISNEDLKNSLIICSSYSGNTEEVIEAYKQAKKKGLALAVVSVGGKLTELAKKDYTPFVQMPDTGIQPRSALGFSLLALLKIIGQNNLLSQAEDLAKRLKPAVIEKTGKKLADKLKDHILVVYSSTRNKAVAYNWKIKLNETGKVPAFYNIIPEMNHNEMNGFDVVKSSKHLSSKFYFLFLKDKSDHKKVQKRMDVTKKLYQDRGLSVEIMELKGQNSLEKIFASLVLADWVAVHTAELYGLESEQVPMIEEFKRLIA